MEEFSWHNFFFGVFTGICLLGVFAAAMGGFAEAACSEANAPHTCKLKWVVV